MELMVDLSQVDLKLLGEQKATLVCVRDAYTDATTVTHLSGLIHLLDYIQDALVVTQTKGLNQARFLCLGAAYLPVSTEDVCDDCDLGPVGSPTCRVSPPCTSAGRLDKQNVIWKKETT